MVAQILVDWFVAEHNPESPPRVCVDGRLQIQCLEGNHVFRWFPAILFNHGEMKLVVDEPVIGHVENRSIFQNELWLVQSLFTVDIDRSLIQL